MTDRRLTPANGRVAHVSLRDAVQAERYVEGELWQVALPLADLLAAPGGRRDRQLLMGDAALVLEVRDGFAFLRSEKDGYCGYVPASSLGPYAEPTHRVAAAATHLYAAPDLKTPEVARLSFGARLTLTGRAKGRFLELADGRFVAAAHVRPIGDNPDDPAAVAEMFLGTPYLWGGNSRDGIDCSGLVQAALLACGIACPGDSDLQFAALGTPLEPEAETRRGDLFFCKGHVAMAADAERIIHANAHRMAVTYEGRVAAFERIRAQEGDIFLGARRL